MGLLRWIGGIVVFFWVVGFILKIGGGLIHMLLVLAVIVFLVDKISGKDKFNKITYYKYFKLNT
ncbi:lmo0937 family membrane protein [Clostridium estertheticum]|uniref:lmo0937 family membrane protein n=1 Tax=Clostridium estertheticum TaxID=238834 RepID=UPI001C7D7C0A|nr:lmo0937 family membrane protein [Clostridium estertheticum]MBX4263655.1 lmo0937 family membrane protein [Clostridium estertheticum]WLC87478.1 lmo0937 family membrane protein [Clostridium estertheticum]